MEVPKQAALSQVDVAEPAELVAKLAIATVTLGGMVQEHSHALIHRAGTIQRVTQVDATVETVESDDLHTPQYARISIYSGARVFGTLCEPLG